MRVLELFSGIGAVHAALGGHATVAGAIDQHPAANATYLLNTGHAARPWNLAGVRAEQLAAFHSELWWMSPPCQPFTVRGLQRDMDDPRSAALLRVLEHVRAVRPARIALENVPGFLDSTMRLHVRSVLGDCGYAITELVICPTELGIPMLRRRYYLLASRGVELFPSATPARPVRTLSEFLEADPSPELYVQPEQIRGFGHSTTVISPAEPNAVATCFTSAYGRSPVRAGAYLKDQRGIRRFSPEEILGLLGFPKAWTFPAGLDRARRYELAGNSLSVDVVRAVLSRHLPSLSSGPVTGRDNGRHPE